MENKGNSLEYFVIKNGKIFKKNKILNKNKENSLILQKLFNELNLLKILEDKYPKIKNHKEKKEVLSFIQIAKKIPKNSKKNFKKNSKTSKGTKTHLRNSDNNNNIKIKNKIIKQNTQKTQKPKELEKSKEEKKSNLKIQKDELNINLSQTKLEFDTDEIFLELTTQKINRLQRFFLSFFIVLITSVLLFLLVKYSIDWVRNYLFNFF